MNRNDQRVNGHEKNRVRDEITAQTQAYLQRGGKIDVVATGMGERRHAIGSVWRTEELADLAE